MPHQLQCPKCNRAVNIGDDVAGQRVKCPHCQKQFLAPGFAAAQNDDDDWLSLDTDVVASPLPSQSTVPVAELLDDSADDAEDEVEVIEDESNDAAIMAKFGDQLNEFTAGIEPLPQSKSKPQAKPRPPAKSHPKSEQWDDVDPEFMLPDLPPVDSFPARSIPVDEVLPTGAHPMDASVVEEQDLELDDVESVPTADAVEYESEYRVKCNICGSLMYAQARQAGKSIRCSDCHSPIKIPPPPRVKHKTKIDVENAKTFSFEESPAQSKKREDPYKKSARELLDEAERGEHDTTEPYQDPDIPSLKEWAMNVFGIFLDIGVIGHWLGLSLLGGVPAAIVFGVGHPLLYTLSAAFALVVVTLTIACGFAIMQSVANQHESVSDWPEADPTAWIDDLVVAVSAVVLAGVPMLTITSFAFGPGLLSTAMTMMSIYFLFPFFVLSMMDMQSIFVPFSPEVARSVTRCQEAWGALYLSAGLLFFGLFLFFVMLSSASPAPAAAIAVVVSIAVTFSYFSMIGRLAYSIGQPVNQPAQKTADSSADNDPESASK